MVGEALLTSHTIMQTLLHHRALGPINLCRTSEPFSRACHFVKRLHLQRLGMISNILWCLPTTCKPHTQNFNRFRPSMLFLQHRFIGPTAKLMCSETEPSGLVCGSPVLEKSIFRPTRKPFGS